MQEVEVLVLPQSLFPTPDTLMSIVNNFDAKPPVLLRFGSSEKVSHFAQVGYAESVSLKEDGLHAVLVIPPEGIEKINKGELDVRGEVSFVAQGTTINYARLVEVKLLPK
jgi:hypothetical protein